MLPVVTPLAGLVYTPGSASPVGDRLLAVKPVSSAYRLMVSPNWGAELRKRLAASREEGRKL